MSGSRIAIVVLFFVALVAPVGAADASTSVLCSGYKSCDDKGFTSYGYDTHKSSSYWRMYTGTNCTNYAAYRLVTTNGMPNSRPKASVGNARDWGTAMASITDKLPAVGAIAWWGKSGHHVAYVEQIVSPTEIVVSESNWSGAFDWRRITKSGSGWPQGFIHFADLHLKNSVKPTVGGTVKVGSTVTASAGKWSPSKAKFAYQWLIDGLPVRGAIARSFTASPEQQGHKLTVQVTASKPSYPTASARAATQTIALGTLTSASSPEITGTPRVDDILTSTPGVWAPQPVRTAYQWFADHKPIDGATSRTFSPGADLAGKRVTVQVTGSKLGYADLISTSAPTPAIAAGPLQNTAKPTIAGSPRVGSKLTPSPGSWSKPGLTYAYQWSVGGRRVESMPDGSYTPVAGDIDQPVALQVTASRPGYVTTSAVSAPTKAVLHGILTMKTKPSIHGHARVGDKLTATPGSWSPGPKLSFQWYSGRHKISHATSQTFVPTAGFRGDAIRVKIIARRPGYTTASSISAPTSAISAGRILFSAAPTISGTAKVGSRLKVNPGTFQPRGATVHYQWLRDGKVISKSTHTTRKLTRADAGSKLAVRLTFSARGYTKRVVTTTVRHVR